VSTAPVPSETGEHQFIILTQQTALFNVQGP
jgi:hypothetical protein